MKSLIMAMIIKMATEDTERIRKEKIKTGRGKDNDKDEKKGKFHKKKATSYDWNYDYKSSHPHAPTHIGCRKYSYDANGNQTGWRTLKRKDCDHGDKHEKHKDSKGSKRRHIVWDEENRIQAIYDEGTKSHYKYGFSGERVVKDTDEGEIVYVNQFYTVKNGSIATKHIFAGKTRVVSNLHHEHHNDHYHGHKEKEKDLGRSIGDT